MVKTIDKTEINIVNNLEQQVVAGVNAAVLKLLEKQILVLIEFVCDSFKIIS